VYVYVHVHVICTLVICQPYMSPSTKAEIDWKAVGRRVREIRGFELKQAEFAAELGVSQGQLSRYEQGSSEIGAAVLLRLARKSGRTIEWILTGRDKA
jgi:DNA-binding transcriptional regulator YiaG